MIVGTKRINRRGLVISALVHAGILAVALLFARSAPHEAVPPDAMQVEIVTPQEIPRYSGTPSMLRTSGTEHAAQSQAATARSERPTSPPPPQPTDQHQAQRNAPPKPQEAQTAPPQTKEPPLPPADTAKVAMVQPAPDPPAPSAKEKPDVPGAAATAEFLALAGGRLGGGFAAPPIDSPFVGYDFTVPFRELISSCSRLPPGISPNEKISITVRVFLNRDGTLAAVPQLLESDPSEEQRALMQTFAGGLQKCQPYTMLPQDQYAQWKVLDLVVSPRNYAAR